MNVLKYYYVCLKLSRSEKRPTKYNIQCQGGIFIQKERGRGNGIGLLIRLVVAVNMTCY